MTEKKKTGQQQAKEKQRRQAGRRAATITEMGDTADGPQAPQEQPAPAVIYLAVRLGAVPMTVSQERFKENPDIYRRYIRVYPVGPDD